MPITEPQARQLVERLAQELRLRQVDIDRWNEYYDGEHPLKYATDAWKKQHGARYQNFSDNWVSVVANSPAERLALSGIRLTGETKADQDLWRVWQINGGDAESSAGFIDVQVAARSFVLVWAGDDEDVPEVTWESPSEMIVAYEPGSHRKRTAALKVWREDETTEHATLYLPDEVWKFRRTTQVAGIHVPGVDQFAWRPRELETEPNPQPNPMGVVPVVELPNRPRNSGKARSEVAGVAAMQDAVNLLWAYLFVTADFASFPQRVVMGQESPKVPILDDKGQVVGHREVPLDKFGQDRVVWLTGKETSISEWSAADLEQFTKIIEVQVGHIAAQTRTPQHYLVGKMANLSGDALKAAETGLVKKVEEQQLFLGPRIAEVFRLIALAKDDAAKAKAIPAGKVLWRDAESRTDGQVADKIIKLKEAGFPFRWLVEEYGMDNIDVQRVMDLREEELRDAATRDVEALFGGGGDDRA
jgi:hypothetical protein